MQEFEFGIELIALLAPWGIWLVQSRHTGPLQVFRGFAIWAVVTPFLMNISGLLLTESGHQPWIVQGADENHQRGLPVGRVN